MPELSWPIHLGEDGMSGSCLDDRLSCALREGDADE